MSDVTPLRIGFIGVSGIANAHMDHLKPLDAVEFAAIADISEETLAHIGDKWEIADRYTDYKQMLTDDNIDAISVCTPNFLHAQPTIDALEAGKHVVVEKPMAMTVAECQQMVDAAKANDRQLVTGFQWRFSAKAQFLAKLHRQQAFGDVQYVRVQALRRRGIPSWGVFHDKEKQGGGALIDMGVHLVEMAHYIIGSPKPVTASASAWADIGTRKPETVTPWGEWNYQDYTVEDLSSGFVRFDNGVTMVIESSFAAHIDKDVHNVEIMGSQGGGSFEPLKFFHDQHGFMLTSEPHHIGKADGFAEKMKHFVEVCRGERDNDSSGMDGLAVQTILNGLYASVDAGKEVDLTAL